MAYLTYQEYVSYGGTIPETAFQTAEFKARKRIDYITDSRVQNMETVPEEVKICMTSIINADAASGVSALTNDPLAVSFNNDGYSESYGSAAEQKAVLADALNNEIKEMLYGVLDDNGTPLLYRGLDK